MAKTSMKAIDAKVREMAVGTILEALQAAGAQQVDNYKWGLEIEADIAEGVTQKRVAVVSVSVKRASDDEAETLEALADGYQQRLKTAEDKKTEKAAERTKKAARDGKTREKAKAKAKEASEDTPPQISDGSGEG